MDKLTKQIFILNKVYLSMKKHYQTLGKMFNKDSNIKQKLLLSEAMIQQVYMSIKDKIEGEETNKQFKRIIRSIENERPKKNT